MSSSSFLLAALLLLPAGVGLAVLAVNEEPEESDTQQQEAGFRSRVFDVSPTHSSNDPQQDPAVPGEHSADAATGTWLSDSLAQLEESYQAMRQQGEELAQEALQTLDQEAPSESPPAPMTSPSVVPEQPADPSASDENGDLVAQNAVAPDEGAVFDQAVAGDQAAMTDQVAVLDQTALVSAATQGPLQATAPSPTPLNPEEAARAEQMRIAVALEKHQAFIISLLPLFLPVPAAADVSVPQAAVPAGPIPLVDMSGLAWGPVDMAGVTNP